MGLKIRNSVEGAVHQGLVLLVPGRFLLTSRGLRGKTLKLESFANEITRVGRSFSTLVRFFSIPSSSFGLHLSLSLSLLVSSPRNFTTVDSSFSTIIVALPFALVFFFLFPFYLYIATRLEPSSLWMTFANYGSELSYPWRLSWNVIDTIDGEECLIWKGINPKLGIIVRC